MSHIASVSYSLLIQAVVYVIENSQQVVVSINNPITLRINFKLLN